MLRIFLRVAVPFLLASGAYAQQQSTVESPYAAGISKLSIANSSPPFDTMIWYPTASTEKPWQAGPFTVAASRDAAPIEGHRFPVVLFSHGSGGSPLVHRELAAMLARAGYIVVAPVHVGDAAGHPRSADQPTILATRPRQSIDALHAVLQDSRLASHIDAERIGMIGYSAGGYTTLVTAGGKPNFQKALDYCAHEGRNDIGSCKTAEERNTKDARAPSLPEAGFKLKALVLMDPLSFLFDKVGLTPVAIPTLLMRPSDDSFLRAAPNALALAENLPTPPTSITVEGGHFVFIDPCPQALREEAPLICEDAPKINRAKIHVEIEQNIRSFLDAHL